MKNSVIYFYIKSAKVLGINYNIIQIYNDKNIKICNKNLINLTLKTGLNIEKSKRYDIVLEIVILNLKYGFIFIIFSNFYLIINVS